MKCAFLFFSFVFPSLPHFALPAFRGFQQDTGEACGAQPVRYSMSFQMPIETATASTVRTGIIMYFARIALPAFFVRSALRRRWADGGTRTRDLFLTKVQPETKGALPATKYPFQISKTPQYLVLFLPSNFSGCHPFFQFDSQIQPIPISHRFSALFPTFQTACFCPALARFL